MDLRHGSTRSLLPLFLLLIAAGFVRSQEADPPVENRGSRRGMTASPGTVPGPDPVLERVSTSLDYQEMRLLRNRGSNSAIVKGDKSSDLEDLGLPERASDEIGKAQRSLKENQPEKALQHLKKAVEIAPRYSKAYNNIGLIYRNMGRLPEAQGAFLKAIEVNPRNATAHRNLGFLYIATNRPESALGPLSLAAHLEPADAASRAFLGDAMFRMGRLGEAEESLKGALLINPDFYPAAYRLGCLYAQQKKIPEAIAMLERVMKMDHPGLETAGLEQLLGKLRMITH